MFMCDIRVIYVFRENHDVITPEDHMKNIFSMDYLWAIWVRGTGQKEPGLALRVGMLPPRFLLTILDKCVFDDEAASNLY